MDEVGTALIAIALVLLAVFIPTAFIGGITGLFYRQFAITIATATAISLFLSLTLSPGLCAILFRAHDAEHARPSLLMRPVHAFFRLFDAAFDALARGYGRLVRGAGARVGGRCWSCYVVLMAFAGWFVQRLPTGFIPSLDRAILIISLQLPPGASLARTDAVVQRGDGHRAVHAGRQVFQRLHRPQRRDLHVRDQRRPACSWCSTISRSATAWARRRQDRPGRCASKLAQIEEAQALRVHPAAGARHGCGGGLLDAAAGYARAWTRREFARITQEFVAEANRTPGIANVFTTFQAATPQVFVDVDRDKAQMLKVPVTNIFEAMRVFMGSAYVNDFNMFGRTYRVTAQADGDYRLDAGERVEDPRALDRGADGAARQPGDVQGDRRPRARAALQPVPVGRGATARRGRASARARRWRSCARWRARSCRRASPTSGPTCPTRRPRSAAPATTSSC